MYAKHLLHSVRANSTFVVASSQSQRVAFMMRSARIAALKLLCSVRGSKTFVAPVYVIPQHLSFVVVLPYKKHLLASVG